MQGREGPALRNFDPKNSASSAIPSLAALSTVFGKHPKLPQLQSEYGDEFFCLADQHDDPRISEGCSEELGRRSKRLLGKFEDNPLLKRMCTHDVEKLKEKGVCPKDEAGDDYECLFTGFMGTRDMRLNPVCNFNTMNLAKLVTARPLDASFVADGCGDVISACRSTCSENPASVSSAQLGNACAWRCLRKRTQGRDHRSPAPSDRCQKAVRQVQLLEHFDVRLNRRVARDCIAEVSTLCQRPPGSMRVLACIKAIGNDASEACQEAIAALPPLKAERRARFARLVALERKRFLDHGMTTRGVFDLVELRGPVALAACAALFVVLVAGGYYLIYRYQRRGYTVFVGKD